MHKNQQLVLTLCLLSCVMLQQTTADGVDCSKLPRPIRPQECCNFNELFKQNALDYCRNAQQLGDQCFYECIFKATEIFRRGEFSYPKAEDYVNWVLKTDDEFSPIYKNAFRKCIEKVNEMHTNLSLHQFNEKHGCSPLPEMVNLCVKNEMFAHCPKDHWNFDVEDCVTKRDFINNCIRED